MPSTSTFELPFSTSARVRGWLSRPNLARLGDAAGQLHQTTTVLRGLQALSPHDQGVLVGLRIVVLADADRREAELVVEVLGAVVGHPHLQRAGGRATAPGLADQGEQQAGGDLAAVDV